MKRILSALVGIALIAGCHGDHGDSSDDNDDAAFNPGGGTGNNNPVVFEDDFATGFPSLKWTLEHGDAAIAGDEGVPAPGLGFGLTGQTNLTRSTLAFTMSGPFTLSFDLMIPAPKTPDAMFEFRFRRDGIASDDAAFIVPAEEGMLFLELAGSVQQFPFASDGQFHTYTLSVDDGNVATWSMDSGVIMSAANFPDGAFRIEIETFGGHSSTFVLDNVRLARTTAPPAPPKS